MRRAWVLLCSSVMVATTVTAATIRVPLDQPTIQDGINAAINGDTVLVSDGTYKGVGNRNISFGGKAIVVRSENGALATIVDVDSTLNRGFIFSSGEDTLSVLDGFTITRAIADTGAGILIYGGSPKILNCRFEKMGFNMSNYPGFNIVPAIHGPMGLGVAVIGESRPVIRQCEFTNLISWPSDIWSSAKSLWGGGFAVDSPAVATVEDCSFHDIDAPFQNIWDALGTCIFDGSGGSKYLRCRVTDNGFSSFHGRDFSVQVFLLNSTSRFDSCLFARNQLDGASFYSFLGATVWLKNSPAVLENCTFFGNYTVWDYPSDQPAAMSLLCTQSAAQITNCIFAFDHIYDDQNPWGSGPRMRSVGTTVGDTVLPSITCTNIFGNLNGGGDWVGPIASQLGVNGNIRRNPYFCDTANYDFHLAPNSPCGADSTGCGLMGAYQMNPSCPPGNCCIGRTGNVDCDPDDRVDISDLSGMIMCLYISPSSCGQHCCPGEENIDGDVGGAVDISDLSALIDYLYISFTLPAWCIQ